MRTFAIPAATLSLSLTTACGPGLSPYGSFEGDDTGSDWPPDDTNVDTNVDTNTDTGTDTNVDTDTGTPPDTSPPDPGAAVAGSWSGTLLENASGATSLPYVYDGYLYYQYIGTTLTLSPQLTGTMHFRNEVLYLGVVPYDYSATYSCTGTATGGNSYNITMQSSTSTLHMQCALLGTTFDCSSTGADPLRLVFTR